ncbi:divalent cation tolerance protein CutA [Streptomyces albidoflavus]|uniref:divalent cation tolerance protein CutA n=1 Tax=Streptomyces albidoflavus TaxID=1886 RepID=UPI0038CF80E1
MTHFLQLSTATEIREQALELARSTVRRPPSAVRTRLAAGAQIIGPVTSVCQHLGEGGEGEEWKLLLTTTAERYAELEQHLLERHPWANPELCAVRVERGAKGDLGWVGESVGVGRGA